MTYKCNMDVSFNLPTRTGFLVDSEGKHCALGKLYAGILGRPLNKQADKQKLIKLEEEFRMSLKLIDESRHSKIWKLNDGYYRVFDVIDNRTGLKYHMRFLWEKSQPEKALRLALQSALESGFIELEDSDIELVKEVKAQMQTKQLAVV
jgi:hypothetical protein